VLFSAQYLYVFEATSILIVAALVGSIALARRAGEPEKTAPGGRS
jgi:NADH:ubiquinone oxidoreductase subunit 6 (subunit J)